jgi:protein BCP1
VYVANNVQVATAVHSFPFKTAPSTRDEESFGVEQFGRLVLVEREKLAIAVEAMEEACR